MGEVDVEPKTPQRRVKGDPHSPGGSGKQDAEAVSAEEEDSAESTLMFQELERHFTTPQKCEGALLVLGMLVPQDESVAKHCPETLRGWGERRNKHNKRKRLSFARKTGRKLQAWLASQPAQLPVVHALAPIVDVETHHMRVQLAQAHRRIANIYEQAVPSPPAPADIAPANVLHVIDSPPAEVVSANTVTDIVPPQPEGAQPSPSVQQAAVTDAHAHAADPPVVAQAKPHWLRGITSFFSNGRV